MLILTFLAILSGAGLALRGIWRRAGARASRRRAALGHALHSRAAMALLLVLPFAAIAATIALNGERLRPAQQPALQNPALDQARKEAPHDLETAVQQLEARLAKEPGDQDGWRLLARSYEQLGKPDKAAEASRRAAALGATSGDAASQSAHGEDLVTAANGTVGPEARQALRSGAGRRPRRSAGAVLPWPRRGAGRQQRRGAAALARARARTRRPTRPGSRACTPISAGSRAPWDWAPTIWRSGAARSPPRAPPLRRSPAPAAAAPGPTSADVAAAAGMTPEDRTAMIRSMVQRLADELAQKPGDVDGWLRLGRAYAVLGEKQKSLDAYRRASEADPERAPMRARPMPTPAPRWRRRNEGDQHEPSRGCTVRPGAARRVRRGCARADEAAPALGPLLAGNTVSAVMFLPHDAPKGGGSLDRVMFQAYLRTDGSALIRRWDAARDAYTAPAEGAGARRRARCASTSRFGAARRASASRSMSGARASPATPSATGPLRLARRRHRAGQRASSPRAERGGARRFPFRREPA